MVLYIYQKILMDISKPFVIVFWNSSIPCNTINKIRFAKDFVANLSQVFKLTIIDTYINDSIICKQVLC